MWIEIILSILYGLTRAAFGLCVGAVVLVAPLAYFGAFGQTGSDYFEQCWEQRAAQANTKLGERPPAKSAAQDVAWSMCDYATQKAVFGLGFVFAGSWVKPGDSPILQECPHTASLPPGAPYVATVQLVLDSGGPTLVDRFLPAEHMIERVWLSKWPRCSKAREGRGYPKIVETKDGLFRWSMPAPLR